MASSATTALRNRDNGRRAEAKHRGKAVDQSFLGVTNLGANRLNLAQIYEIAEIKIQVHGHHKQNSGHRLFREEGGLGGRGLAWSISY